MTYLLEAVRNKPRAFWNLDDDSPFQDYSGYSRTGSSTTQPDRHPSLVAGAVYASIFKDTNRGSFDSPVFNQGFEKQSFSLAASIRQINKTTGIIVETVNTVLNPSIEVSAANWITPAAAGGKTTLSRVTSWFSQGTASLLMSKTTDNLGPMSAIPIGSALNGTRLLSAGQFVKSQFTVRNPNASAREVYVQTYYYNSTPTQIGSIESSAAYVLPASGTVTVKHTSAAAPVGTAYSFTAVTITNPSGGGFPMGASVNVDGVIITVHDSSADPYPDYFDGSSANAEWVGTANASYSKRRVSSAMQQILGHSGYDGLLIEGTKVIFKTTYLTTGEAVCSYDLQIPRAVDIVATHTVEKNSLYIDGELVAEANISAEQQADKYLSNSTTLLSGTSSGSQELAVNGIGIYDRALPPDIIRRMHSVARKVPNNTVPAIFGGDVIEMSLNSVDIFLDQTWDTQADWKSGVLKNVSVDEDRLIPATIDDVVVAGEWLSSYALNSAGVTSIFGVIPMWSGEGAIVEASIDDGASWEVLERGKNISIIPAGFNPTDKELDVRVRFDAGVSIDSYIDNLNIVGLKTGAPAPLSGRTVIHTSPAYIGRDYPSIEYRDNWGTRLVGGNVTIGEDLTAPFDMTGTREYWVMPLNDAVPSISPSADAVYIDGQLSSLSNLKRGRWSLLHLTNAVLFNSSMSIGGNLLVGQAALYPTTLTASEIESVYKQYTGQTSTRVGDNSDIVITQSATAANIYAHDWAISTSG